MGALGVGPNFFSRYTILGIALVFASMTAFADEESLLDANSILPAMDSFQALRQAEQQVRAEASVRRFLSTPEIHAFSITQRISGKTIETTKFQHYYKGIEVVGSMSLHHRKFGANSIQSNLRAFDLSTQPSLSATDAVAVAQSEIEGIIQSPAGEPVLKILPDSNGDSAKLIYWVKLQPRVESGLPGSNVLVDAHSGQIVARLSHYETVAPVRVLNAQRSGIALMPQVITDPTGRHRPMVTGCKIVELATGQLNVFNSRQTCEAALSGRRHCQVLNGEGDPIGIDLGACPVAVDRGMSLAASDESSIRGAENALRVLEYYKTHHQRDSYDGRGSPLTSMVHVGFQMGNAMWDIENNRMLYGDGDGVHTRDFTLATDVAGHEMTHGITSHTAQLISLDESGALNESYSDFFGKLIANDQDWVMGKQLPVNANDTTGLRDLAQPGRISTRIVTNNGTITRVNYPAHVREKVGSGGACTPLNDNCWVHINSTIPSHGAYLVAQSIGRENAEILYYTVLTHYLTANSNFRRAGLATREACNDLRMGSTTCNRVSQALDQVGM